MSLRKKLLDEKGKRHFISIVKLEELVTLSSVEEFLTCYFHESIAPLPLGLLEKIIPKARKLFAVLVLAELDNCIANFILDRGITDSVFPANNLDVTLPLDNTEERRRFLKEQWAIPPVLSADTHLEFPLGTVLPYLKEEFVGNGSFGLVYKVRVAEGHLRAAGSGYTTTLDVALKKIYVDDRGDLNSIMQEVIALRHGLHPNIIPLLASYTEYAVESGAENISVNMLFPYAEMDMEKWLYLRKPPTFLACQSRSEQRWYLYAAMSDLVSALSALHREAGGLVASHHDLKPKNILVVGEKLMIADLGRSERAHLEGMGGSEVDGSKGLGTKAYQPPEYCRGDNGLKKGKQKFGRAFDMWAMGCIMVQVAVLCVWGWESRQVEIFRKEREEFVHGQTDQGDRSRSWSNDSFVKSIPVIDAWLARLQEDGSATLQGYLAVIIQMLREDPLERIYSWEAELDLYELLHQDESIKARFKKTADLVQAPPPGKDMDGAETPIHRAAKRGNLTRVINLLEMGWPVELKDNTGHTPAELAEQNGHLQTRDIILQASTIKRLGWKSVLEGVIPTPVIHAIEGSGFRLKQQNQLQGVDKHHHPKGDRGPSASLTDLDLQKEPTVLKIGHGRTMLHEAVRRDDEEVLRSHINHGGADETASPSANFGQTPLHSASAISAKAVSDILKTVKDVNPLVMAQDRNGRIPLHTAVKAGKLEIVEALLSFCSNKADMRRRMLLKEDNEGITPLKAAWEGGEIDVSQILAKYPI